MGLAPVGRSQRCRSLRDVDGSLPFTGPQFPHLPASESLPPPGPAGTREESPSYPAVPSAQSGWHCRLGQVADKGGSAWHV